MDDAQLADAQQAMREAFRNAYGIVRLSRKLGVTRNALHQWKVCPHDRVLEIESISGVHCSRLRPDLYPPERFGNV